MMAKSSENCSEAFLDGGQYQMTNINRYEAIFGDGFVSTGGEETTKKFVATLGLKPGMKVLDIASGSGGSSFLMADNYGAEVVGVDFSRNMVINANRHLETKTKDIKEKVKFLHQDIVKAEFPDNSFDVVYSRDSIMHIGEKPQLYAKILRWLKPGGKMLVTEYTHGPTHPNHCEAYWKYLSDRGYKLLTLAEYERLLKNTGFSKVQVTNKNKDFKDSHKRELEAFEGKKEVFLEQFSMDDFNHIVTSWKTKIKCCEDGEIEWGYLTAEK